jgi:hypothetical protein
VTRNDRIDYFEQNVYIAARIQSLADGHEVYMSRVVIKAPSIGDILKAQLK